MPDEISSPGETIPPGGATFDRDDNDESVRIVAETASDAIITIDEESTILFVNPAAEAIFGHSIDEMLGKSMTMLMPDYLRHVHRAGLKRFLETGEKHFSWEAVELPGLHKNGHIILLEVSFGELTRDGKHFFTGIARDVTERKKTILHADLERNRLLAREQEARREAEAVNRRLSSLQKVTDAALAHLSLNDLFAELLNRIRDVLQVDTAAILLLETEGERLVAWAARGLEEEVERGVHIPVGKGFAGRIAAEARALIIEDLDKAELVNPLLREKGIRSLLGVPMLIEGRVVGVLHVGRFTISKFTDDDVALLQLVADRIALATENARLYEIERRARAEAENANRAKDEFLTILSHELRTPLTPIVGWVHMMRQGILSERDSTRALSVLSKNSKALKHLINDLLDMSAIISGKMRIEEGPVALTESLCEAVDALRQQAEEREIKLDLSLPERPNSLIVKGDRARLVQVFSNLIHNAIKFSEAGSSIRISCLINAGEALVRVEDQGEGITSDFLPYVFERFRQADGSRTRSHGGLGLGLALVKSFIEAHGGTVEAISRGQSQGSIFTVRLPVHAPLHRAARGDTATQDVHSLTRARLLIVEDEEDTLEMLGAIFQARGFETHLCNSAIEALKIVEQYHFDLIISDIAMPSMDGFELIRRLRRHPGYRNVLAVALTGYASEKDSHATLAAGFNVHIPKPVDPIELSNTVEALLESKSVESTAKAP